MFLLLEDETGLANIIVYPTLMERQRSLIRLEPFVIVSGHVQRQDGVINVVAESLRPLRRANPCLQGLVAPPSHDFY